MYKSSGMPEKDDGHDRTDMREWSSPIQESIRDADIDI